MRPCTAVTNGTVVKYVFYGESRIEPVGVFVASGKIYRSKKKYNGVPNRIKENVWEDEKGWLHVKNWNICQYAAAGGELVANRKPGWLSIIIR